MNQAEMCSTKLTLSESNMSPIMCEAPESIGDLALEREVEIYLPKSQKWPWGKLWHETMR